MAEPVEELVRDIREHARDGLIVICGECGESVEISDVRSLVLALHLRDVCESTRALFAR